MSLTAPRRVDNQPIRPLVPRRSLRSGGVVRSLYVATLLLGDVVAIALALVAAYHIHAAMEERPSRVAPLEAYTPTLLFLIASLLVTFALYHHYLPRRGGSRVDQLGQLLLAVTVGNIVALALSALTRRGLDIPQQVLGYGWALAIVFVWTTRTMIELGLRAARRAGLDPERVLIIGAGNEGNTISHKIASAPDLGFDLVGFVDDEEYGPVSRPWEDSRRGAPVLGGISELSQLLRRYRISRVIVADLSLSHAQILDDVVAVCDQARVDVLVVPDVFHLVVQEVSASEFGGMPMLRVRDVSMRGWNLRVKRALDVALATVLLIALSPFLIAVAVLVKVTSRGPVFFVQERVGMDGREFLCIKFRSMRLDA